MTRIGHKFERKPRQLMLTPEKWEKQEESEIGLERDGLGTKARDTPASSR
jgi:hypothetical protein